LFSGLEGNEFIYALNKVTIRSRLKVLTQVMKQTPDCLIHKVQAVGCSERSVSICKSTGRKIPVDLNI